ncbi:BnaA09g03430D [Brassica napus]|uniref:AT-hook motif nuclear-localized protein n=1 Tax=Brassica napus TaxID=3708 RepID=A0A078J3V6_BRANA|nr:BnaA09g03430D [Brassica napus]
MFLVNLFHNSVKQSNTFSQEKTFTLGKSGQSFVNTTPGEGQYEILSLNGSYIRGEHGGKTGGLSVCLSSSDGFGGGVGGPLKAAGPVQVVPFLFSILVV